MLELKNINTIVIVSYDVCARNKAAAGSIAPMVSF